MKKFLFSYPGDPVVGVVQMTRAEFLLAYPRTPIEIWANGRLQESIPLAPDEIACDACNDDPGEVIMVIPDQSRAYCPRCAKEYLEPHLTENNNEPDRSSIPSRQS